MSGAAVAAPGAALNHVAVAHVAVAHVTVAHAALKHAARQAMLALSVDGVALGVPALARGAEQPLVPLEAVAAALGWQVVPVAGGARFSDGDRALVVSAGSRAVREDGEPRPLFAAPPVDRGGHLFLGATDTGRLFGVRLARAGGRLSFVRPPQLSTRARIVELARPATPRPSPTPKVAAQRAADGGAAGGRAGRIVLSLERIGATRLLQLASQTSSAGLQTFVSAAGVNGLGTPSATVVLGSPARSLALGMLPDPLSGAILRGGVYEGLVASDGPRAAFAGRRLDDGLSEVGALLADPLHGGAMSLAVLSRDGAYEQTILRRSSHRHQPWGDFTSEVLLGDRGLGAGIGARTRGRTFLESTVAWATHGLPLGPSDAPLSLDLGRQLSTATTLVGGASSGPRQPLAPFFGLSSRSRDLLGSVSVSGRAFSASASYQSAVANLQAYAVPGAQHSAGLQGMLFLPAATVEATASASSGSREAALTLRTLRPGINLVAGAGVAGAGRIGPIAGLSVPVGPDLALEATLRPAGSAQTALRLALALALPGRRGPHAAVGTATVRVAGAAPGAMLQLYVDGVPLRRFAAPGTTVAVARGAHTFAVRSDDGATGSPDGDATIGGRGGTVELALWPEREVRGQLVADGHSLRADVDLAGIVVTIEPGGPSAHTDADGRFVFARQPVAPGATIAVDPASLPRELRAPDPAPLGEGDLRLVLAPGLRIERQTFPAQR